MKPLSFEYHGDCVEVYPMRLFYVGKPSIFFSTKYQFGFRNFASYWQELGKRKVALTTLAARTQPKTYTTVEILQRLAKLDLGDHPGVIVYDLDLRKIGKLRERIPGVSRLKITDEVVVFPCESKETARKLALSLPTSLGTSLGFFEGFLFCSNVE